MKIAFFDSGIGGLTVLHEALKIMPNEQYIYFADSDYAPYGTKSSATIKELVSDAVDFLVQKEIKALVLACNTATSVAIKELRAQYDFPIIGMEPAIKPAVQSSKDKKTLVCATDKTLAEEKLHNLIQNLNATSRVECLSLQELVLFAEKFDFKNPQIIAYLKMQFESINWTEFDSIVLGCTHFPFFKTHLKTLLPLHIRILDGNLGTVKHLKSRLKPNQNSTQEATIDFYTSKKPVDAQSFDKYFNLLNHQSTLL